MVWLDINKVLYRFKEECSVKKKIHIFHSKTGLPLERHCYLCCKSLCKKIFLTTSCQFLLLESKISVNFKQAKGQEDILMLQQMLQGFYVPVLD